MQLEHFFHCPFCAEEISVLLDLSEEESSYIEDCQVCCRPMQLSFIARDGALISFAGEAA